MKPIDGAKILVLLLVEYVLLDFLLGGSYRNNPVIASLYYHTGIHISLLLAVLFVVIISILYGFRKAGKIILALGILIPGLTFIFVVLATFFSPGSTSGVLLFIAVIPATILALIGSLLIGVSDLLSRITNKPHAPERLDASHVLYYSGIAVAIALVFILSS